jgi:Flp pilus assembly protein TadG
MRPRRRRAQRGQSLVEIAFVVPIFILLLMVIIDVGRVIYVQNAASQMAREGARVASLSVDEVYSSGTWTIRYAAIRTAALRSWSSFGDVGLSASSIRGDDGSCAAPLPGDPTVPGTCFYPQGYYAGNPGIVLVNVTVEVRMMTPMIASIVGSPCPSDPSQRCIVINTSAQLRIQS